MNHLEYKKRYQKYKLKYLQLKQNKQTGGMEGVGEGEDEEELAASEIGRWWEAHADNSILFITGEEHKNLVARHAAFQWKFGRSRLKDCMKQKVLDKEGNVWKAMTDEEKESYEELRGKEKKKFKEDMCLRYLPKEAREYFGTNPPAKGDPNGKVMVTINGKPQPFDSNDDIFKQPIVLNYDFTTLGEYVHDSGEGYPLSEFDFVVSLQDREHKLFRVSYDYLKQVKEDFEKRMSAYQAEGELTTPVDVPSGSTVELVKPFYGDIYNLYIVFVNCLFDLEIQRIISIIWEYRKDANIKGEGGRNTNNRVAASDENATVLNCRLRSDVCSFVDIPEILRTHLLGKGEVGCYSVPYHSGMLDGWLYDVHPMTQQLTRPHYKIIKTKMHTEGVKGTNTHVLSASFVSGVVLPCAHALNDKFNLPLSCVSLTELMLTDSSTNEARPECHKFFAEPRSDSGGGHYAGKDEVLLRSPKIDKHHLASMFAAYLTSQNKSKMMLKGRLIRNIACSAQVFIVLLNNYKKNHEMTTTHPCSKKSQDAMNLQTHILAKLRELGIMSTFSHSIKDEEENRLEKAKNAQLVRERLSNALKPDAEPDPNSLKQILQELKTVEAEERDAVVALEAAAAAAAAPAANTTAAQTIAKQYEEEGKTLPPALGEWLSFCSDVGPLPKNTEHKQMREGTHDELNFLEMFTNDKSLENIIKNIISRGNNENGTQLSESLQNLIKLEFDFDEKCSNCNKVFWDPEAEQFYSYIERSITVENGQIKFKCSNSSCTQKLGYSLDHILKPWESTVSNIQKEPMDNSYNFIQYFINLLVGTFIDFE